VKLRRLRKKPHSAPWGTPLTFIDPYWRGSGWIRSRGYLDTIRRSSDRDISSTPVQAPISSLNDLYVGEINVLILSARVGRNANRSGGMPGGTYLVVAGEVRLLFAGVDIIVLQASVRGAAMFASKVVRVANRKAKKSNCSSVRRRAAVLPHRLRNGSVEQALFLHRPTSTKVLELQRQIGNQAVVGLLARQPITQQERARTGQGGKINGLLTAIQTLKALRIDTWKETAAAKEPKPGQQVLEIIIAIASEGLGGVVYGLIDEMMKGSTKHLLTEFLALAGLEAGDLAAEAIFHKALHENQEDLEKGTRRALQSSKQSSATALATKGDIISAYAEALKLQSVQEFVAQSGEFNDSAANMTDQDLAARYAALKLTYDKLMADPSAFLRELTTGFIRLLDEVTLAEKDKEHEGKRERTWAEEDELHWADLRLGNLMVFPWPRGHSLGKWSKPDLGFSEYNATGIGVNTKTLETLLNGKVGNIPVSMGFRYRVANPFYRIWEGDLGLADVRFTRSPTGPSTSEAIWTTTGVSGWHPTIRAVAASSTITSAFCTRCLVRKNSTTRRSIRASAKSIRTTSITES